VLQLVCYKDQGYLRNLMIAFVSKVTLLLFAKEPLRFLKVKKNQDQVNHYELLGVLGEFKLTLFLLFKCLKLVSRQVLSVTLNLA